MKPRDRVVTILLHFFLDKARRRKRSLRLAPQHSRTRKPCQFFFIAAPANGFAVGRGIVTLPWDLLVVVSFSPADCEFLLCVVFKFSDASHAVTTITVVESLLIVLGIHPNEPRPTGAGLVVIPREVSV